MIPHLTVVQALCLFRNWINWYSLDYSDHLPHRLDITTVLPETEAGDEREYDENWIGSLDRISEFLQESNISAFSVSMHMDPFVNRKRLAAGAAVAVELAAKDPMKAIVAGWLLAVASLACNSVQRYQRH